MDTVNALDTIDATAKENITPPALSDELLEEDPEGEKTRSKRRFKKVKPSRMTISVPTPTRKALEFIADERGVSLAAVIKAFIGQGLAVEREVRNGGVLIIERENGEKLLVTGGG